MNKDVTEILHADKCACLDCRKRKGDVFRVVVETPLTITDFEEHLKNLSPFGNEFEYKTYRLRKVRNKDFDYFFVYEEI